MKTFKDLKELRALDAEALNKELATAELDLLTLRLQMSANELKQPHLIRVHRRYIARIKTLKTAA